MGQNLVRIILFGIEACVACTIIAWAGIADAGISAMLFAYGAGKTHAWCWVCRVVPALCHHRDGLS